MQKANHIVTGMLAGLILPVAAWFLADNKFNGIPFISKPGLPYLFVILVNLLALRYCYKKDMQQAGNGIMLATFMFMLAVFFVKLKH